MTELITLLLTTLGLFSGGIIVHFFSKKKFLLLQEQYHQSQNSLTHLQATQSAEKKAFEDKLTLLENNEQKLTQAFKALSHEALQSNNKSFLDLAQSSFGQLQESAKGDLEKRQQSIHDTINPIKQALEKFDTKVNSLEKAREGAYAGLSEQVKNLLSAQVTLQSETSSLAKALGSPNVRGKWGEMHLRKTVELAGMLNKVDFVEQETTENGRFRPDMIIHLPGERKIVVDSKAPLSAFLASIEEDQAQHQQAKLKEHARHIREHLTHLGSKAYWKYFKPTPEFVVLFLPGENFFSAALEQDPELVDFGIANHVILATPTTLIALLKSVAFGWRQEAIAQEAKTISELGQTLYERMNSLASHFSDMRKGIERLVTSYNKSISCLESRILPTARKFRELDSTNNKEIPDLSHVELPVSTPKSPELEVI